MTWFIYLVIIVGIWRVLWWILTPLTLCFRHCCRCKQNLRAKYGREHDNCYAVVTGGSDGIGLALCHQLAEQGFNICMISRNKAKMDEKLEEIKAKHPSRDCFSIVCDFSK